MSDNNENEEYNKIWRAEIGAGIILTTIGSILTGIIGWMIIYSIDMLTRIAFIPFLMFSIPILLDGIVCFMQVRNLKRGVKDSSVSAEYIIKTHEKLEKADKVLSKIPIFAILLFAVGFLTVMAYLAINGEI